MQIADSKTDDELEKNQHDDDIQGFWDTQGAAKLAVLKNKDSALNIILCNVLVDSTMYLLEDLWKLWVYWKPLKTPRAITRAVY